MPGNLCPELSRGSDLDSERMAVVEDVVAGVGSVAAKAGEDPRREDAQSHPVHPGDSMSKA